MAKTFILLRVLTVAFVSVIGIAAVAADAVHGSPIRKSSSAQSPTCPVSLRSKG